MAFALRMLVSLKYIILNTSATGAQAGFPGKPGSTQNFCQDAEQERRWVDVVFHGVGRCLSRIRGQWSIRINDQWRLVFDWDDGGSAARNVEIVDYH